MIDRLKQSFMKRRRRGYFRHLVHGRLESFEPPFARGTRGDMYRDTSVCFGAEAIEEEIVQLIDGVLVHAQ